MKLTKLICTLCLSSAHFLAAQNFLVSEPLSIRNDYGYELIGRLRDRILLFRDRYDEFEIQAYDSRLQFSWNKELEDIEKRGTQILAVVGSKNDFSVIYKTRRRGTTLLKIHKYDPGATLIDTMTVKNYGERIFESPILDIVRSEDKNCFVVYNTAKRTEIDLICFRLDKMQVLWEKKLNVDASFFDSNRKDMALSDAGEFYLVSEFNNRKNRMDEHAYQINVVGPAHEAIVNVPLDAFLTNDVSFVFDNENRRLTAAGLYGEKNRDRANGAFYLTLPVGSAAATVNFAPFDDKFLSIFRGKELEEDTRGIPDATVQQVVLRKDGGLVLVGEQQQEIQRGASANRGFWRDGVRMVVDYYYNDIFAVSLGQNGTTHWKTVLHKKQYSQDDDATFSSFFIMKTAEKLRILFNDEIKHENTCSEYVISPLGSFDRNGLMSTENQSLRLRFRDAIQLNTEECLVPSEYRNKLRLVLLRI